MTTEDADLERLWRRFPVARGRFAKGSLQETMLKVEQTSRLIEAKPNKRRSPRETTKIHRDLVDHQGTLVRQVDALLVHGMAVDADIAVIAGHLRRTQYVAAQAADLASRAHGAIEQVTDALADLAEFAGDLQTRLDGRIDDVARRLAELEARVSRVEAELAANQSLDRIVSRWRGGRTYDDVPWAYAVTLLAYEVFAGPVGSYELSAGIADYRERLAEAVLAAGPAPWGGRRPAERIVAEAADALGSGKLAEEVGEWLGAGLDPDLDGDRGELTAALRDRISGANGGLAIGGLTLTAEGFVDQVVHEQAETLLEQRKIAWSPDLGPFGAG